jgi:hypothetical protein
MNMLRVCSLCFVGELLSDIQLGMFIEAISRRQHVTLDTLAHTGRQSTLEANYHRSSAYAWFQRQWAAEPVTSAMGNAASLSAVIKAHNGTHAYVEVTQTLLSATTWRTWVLLRLHGTCAVADRRASRVT